MLRKLQSEIKKWAETNFGIVPAWQPLLGLFEEVGELAHAFLKRQQGIRGKTEKHNEDIRDAVGDIVIYLMDFCNKEGIDLEKQIIDTWNNVKKRDWKNDPLSGVGG